MTKLSPDVFRQGLPETSAFVDVLDYDRWEFDPSKPGRDGTRITPRYVAFVVSRDRPVERIEVGEAEPIEAALEDWLHLIGQRKEHEQPRVAEKLRRLLWEPIAERLTPDTGRSTWPRTPALSRLPWPALPGRKPGSILLEDHALALVPNGPFLLGQMRAEMRFGKGTARRWWWAASGKTCRAPNANSVCCRRCTATRRSPWMDRPLTSAEWSRIAAGATWSTWPPTVSSTKRTSNARRSGREQADALLASREILAGPAGLAITAGAKSPLAYTGLRWPAPTRRRKRAPTAAS